MSYRLLQQREIRKVVPVTPMIRSKEFECKKSKNDFYDGLFSHK